MIGYETGVASTVDPLGGSYFVESLTDELEAARAGATSSGSTRWAARWRRSRPGFYQDEIHEAAYRIQQAIEHGRARHRRREPLRGRARSRGPRSSGSARRRSPAQVARLRALRAARDQAGGRRGARSRRGAARGAGQPAAADARGAARARDARRGLRRAAARLRRVPPRSTERRPIAAWTDRRQAGRSRTRPRRRAARRPVATPATARPMHASPTSELEHVVQPSPATAEQATRLPFAPWTSRSSAGPARRASG